MATLIKLLSKEGMAVSIQDVCNNIEKLCNAKLESKIFYQYPNVSSNSSCRRNFTDVRGTTCTRCKAEMLQMSNYVVPNTPMDLTAASGSVSTGGCVTYLVMDDLEVRPMSSVISGIALVNDFNVKNVAALIQRKVQIGVVEVVELLKASLQTKDVLTTVFL